MSDKQEKMKVSVWEWAILVCAALLLGVSVWSLRLDFSMMAPRFEYAMSRRGFLPWHSIQVIIALALAVGVGRWLKPKYVLRFWWAPIALLIIIAVTPPFRFTDDLASVLSRSPGWVFALFAVTAGLRFALPAWLPGKETSGPSRVHRNQVGMAVYLMVLIFAALYSSMMSRTVFSLSLVLFGMISITTWVVLCGWRRWLGLFMASSVLALTWLAAAYAHPELAAAVWRSDPSDAFQAHQSLLAIHAGGLTGFVAQPVFVPESTTDFMLARVCMGGGLMTGIAVLVITGLLLTLAWRAVARQHDPRLRTVAACIAALWSVCALAHIAINIVLWPTMGIAFPFLSLGRVFLLMHAILLGILISISRDRCESSDTDRQAVPPRWPVTVIQVCIVVLLAFFLVRLCWIVFGDHSIRQQRQAEFERIEARLQAKAKPVRGRILDVDGRVLAQYGERHYVCADPHFLADSPDRHLQPDLLRMIGLDAEAFERRTTNTRLRYVRLATVPTTTAEAVRRMNLRGIFIDTQPSRDYPFDTPLTHIAGFVNIEMVGGSGVEQSQNAALAAGGDVRLTLDAELQTAVQSIADQTPAAQVQIVVMNPRTGAIRAAAQVPSTHGVDFSSANPRARTWRSNMEVFEPGGLIQPLVVASALELDVIKADTPINTENGVWSFHGVPMRDPHPYAEMTPSEILVRAGNIGMAKIGIEMGTNTLHEAIMKWGLNTRAATCIPGAEAGTLHRPERWSKIEITRMPIGHGVACTLMQIMRAYTAFFNDGRVVEPYLIEDGKRDAVAAAWVPVTTEAAALVRDMMERVVKEGTARAAYREDATVFGKTAVVQKPIPGGYAEDRFQTAFIGGFEQEGGEPVLIAVWLDEPEEAAPDSSSIFRAVADTVLEPH